MSSCSAGVLTELNQQSRQQQRQTHPQPRSKLEIGGQRAGCVWGGREGGFGYKKKSHSGATSLVLCMCVCACMCMCVCVRVLQGAQLEGAICGPAASRGRNSSKPRHLLHVLLCAEADGSGESCLQGRHPAQQCGSLFWRPPWCGVGWGALLPQGGIATCDHPNPFSSARHGRRHAPLTGCAGRQSLPSPLLPSPCLLWCAVVRRPASWLPSSSGRCSCLMAASLWASVWGQACWWPRWRAASMCCSPTPSVSEGAPLLPHAAHLLTVPDVRLCVCLDGS